MSTRPFIQEKQDQLLQKYALLGSKLARSLKPLTQNDLSAIHNQVLLDIASLVKERGTMPNSNLPTLETKLLNEADLHPSIRRKVINL